MKSSTTYNLCRCLGTKGWGGCYMGLVWVSRERAPLEFFLTVELIRLSSWFMSLIL